MALQIGTVAPDFEAETTEGKIKFHDWIGNNWVLLFSHPKDFTPVCTTELGALAKLKPEFDKRGVNQTVRNVFVSGTDKKIKLVMVYTMTTGRNFQKILRSIDSLQKTAK